uniref:Sodium/solute symporter n=1 Tax=Paecilomyces fulvus TaxID=89137 RepID=A0A172WCW0_9EURO|nr:sodium/solute symporter [Paecilomyces fulvus]
MTTTANGVPALYGAIGSFFSPALYSVLIPLYKPYKFDWREFPRIELQDEAQLHASTTSTVEDTKGNRAPQNNTIDGSTRRISETARSERIGIDDPEDGHGTYEKTLRVSTASSSTQLSLDDVRHPFDEGTLKELYRWLRIAWLMFFVIVLITFVLWPMPLYRNYIFTKSFFGGWTTVAIMWQFGAFFAVVIFPLYDGRYEIAKGAKGVGNACKKYLNRG